MEFRCFSGKKDIVYQPTVLFELFFKICCTLGNRDCTVSYKKMWPFIAILLICRDNIFSRQRIYWEGKDDGNCFAVVNLQTRKKG